MYQNFNNTVDFLINNVLVRDITYNERVTRLLEFHEYAGMQIRHALQRDRQTAARDIPRCNMLYLIDERGRHKYHK